AEEALRESEEKLRTTIENINDIIIWRMDEKGIFTYLSPAVLNILGYEPDEMEETSGFSYFKPEDKLLLQEKMAARITGDRTPNEFEMVAKDGSLIPMEIISSAIKNENGDTVGFSGIARDISERKKAEEEILKLKDGLEVQVAEKTKELKEKVSDLQRFFDATVDRELRMKELSDENEKLKAELEKKT
ncbi:MAG: PAS domain S-box protein, partial [Candidatus Aminicenantes bacterium]|nr:PAS domain S-box protein [Candidatus Aminicenantes bacterium]